MAEESEPCYVNDCILGTCTMPSYKDSEAAFSSYIASHRG